MPIEIQKIVLIVLGTISPFAAFANAGTPMIWFGVFHLLFVNAIIGFIESNILLKRGFPNRTGLIIAGNYISMATGMFLIAPYFTNNLYHINFWSGETFQYNPSYKSERSITFLIGIVLSFLATLLIEFPFFYHSLKDKAQRELLFMPFIIANTITNIAMTAVYYLFILSA